ncbi:ATP-grasp domain-containing protein [Candidatus Woesearchaeota archaeon]|nr:ATP-grasp domain-containing protein [Candidatus Woesearchaeota archaeon]
MVNNAKTPIGIIYYEAYHDYEDKMLPRALKKKNMDLVLIPAEKQLDFYEIRERTKKCKIIYNDTICQPMLFESLELSKTLEEFGKKVINSSYSFFYQEDRWMFYLKCLEHGIPTPKTYLLHKETKYSKDAIKEVLKKNPLVLKGIFSDNAKLVEKVADYNNFLKKIKKISNKDKESPIIAQEYIQHENKSYRATMINYKLKQFTAKISKNWKQTGSEKEHFRLAKVNKYVKDLCERTARILGMPICGMDLIFNSGKWYIIEANSCPALNFIYEDEKRLIKILANYLYSECKKLK